MASLAASAELERLAGQLRLRRGRDPVERLRAYALQEVARLIAGYPVADLPGLLRLVALGLSVKLEYVRESDDVGRLAARHRRVSTTLQQQLEAEFLRGDTLGYLVEHARAKPGDLRYVAFIDARGERSVRAYFTAWHELTHRILTPPQLVFPGFRRVTLEAVEKDPLEAVVDRIAGELAFYEPLFKPVLLEEISRETVLSLEGIERVRARAVPEASFYATALASVRLSGLAACFVFVHPALKKRDVERLRSPQLLFPGVPAEPGAAGVLRAVSVAAHDAARQAGLRVFRNMRVPENSVLARAHACDSDCLLAAQEDQSWWETSSGGRLPPLPLGVEAERRGAFVYGLISLRTSPRAPSA